MSKTYFDLDIQGKKELKEKKQVPRPENFASATPVEEIKTTVETTTETTTIAPIEEAVEEVEEEYPLNQD